MPKISILSPAYNHGKYIAEAIQSVLAQTLTDFEYIISDDASTDNTVAEIKRFTDPRITLITNNENCGGSVNSSRCWRRASGQYIAWLTTDDILEPRALEIASRYLDENSNTAAIFSRCTFINELGQIQLDSQGKGALSGSEWKTDGIGLNRFELLNTIFYHKHVFCAPTLVIRREVLEKIGYYPANLRQINDTHLWIKLLFAENVVILPDITLRFRIRDGGENLSTPSPENLTRFSFEMTEVLELFTENITSYATLVKIFPDIQRRDWPPEDRFVQFYLAQLSLEFPHPSYWLYALRLFYRIFSSEELAKELKNKLNFGYKEYFELTGKLKVIYDPEIANYKEHYQNMVEKQKLEIDRMSKHISTLIEQQNTLQQRTKDSFNPFWMISHSIKKLRGTLSRILNS